jgi:FtsH-binding integral membrane protein
MIPSTACPASCRLVFLVVELIVHPVLYYTTGSVTFPLMLAYCALALAAMLHTLIRTPGAELSESGMFLVLAGLLTTIAALVTAMVLPVSVPAWVYSAIIAVFPLALAAAVRKQARLLS